MGTTMGWASARIAEKTNAALCEEEEFEGRESSLTARSWRFHSQLASARARPRKRRSGSAAASSLIAAETRWRRASYRRVSNRLRTGTPMVRSNRDIAGTTSMLRGSVSNSVSRSSRRSGSRGSYEQEPAVLSNQARAQSAHVVVFFIAGGALETSEDGLESRKVGSAHGNAPERFDKSCKQCGCFRRGLIFESLQRTTTQIFRRLIRPQRFDDGSQLIEARGH